MGEGLKRANAAARATRTTPPLAAEIDRLRAELAEYKEAGDKLIEMVMNEGQLVDAARAEVVALKAALGEATQAINTMLDLWAAHTSSPPASRADETERTLNRVRRAGAHVSRALKEKSDG